MAVAVIATWAWDTVGPGGPAPWDRAVLACVRLLNIRPFVTGAAPTAAAAGSKRKRD